MGPIEKKTRRQCRAVLRKIEAHLQEHPCGETYFGIAAAGYPLAIKNLREGKIVGPAILDKLLTHIEQREAGLTSGGGAKT